MSNDNNLDPMMDVELNANGNNVTTRTQGVERKGMLPTRSRKIILVGAIFLVVVAVVAGTTLGVVRPGTSSQESAAAASDSGITSPTSASDSGITSPTNTPTLPPPTTSPTLSPSLAANAFTLPPDSGPYVCTGDDRLNHEEPLYSGQVLCSNNDKYVFGMHSDGRFIKWDVIDPSNKYDVFYTGQPGDWFILQVNGDIEIYNIQNELQWKREAKFDMTFATCLTKYACPYMHLHDDGVLVLNWRDSNGVWQVHQLKEAYDL